MLIESFASLVALRCRTVALWFGNAVSTPLFGGAAFGLASGGTLARDPQVNDLSHARVRLANARG
jgi:hypothetical protein